MRDLVGCHDVEHRAQILRPLPEYLDICVWYAEQAADQSGCQRRICRYQVAAFLQGSDRSGRHLRGRASKRLNRPRGERTRDERPNATVIIALGREHQRAVPVAEGSVGNAHHVEQRQPYAGKSLIVGKPFDVALAQHNRGSGHLVNCEGALVGRLLQNVVQFAGKRTGEINVWLFLRTHTPEYAGKSQMTRQNVGLVDTMVSIAKIRAATQLANTMSI